MSPHSPKIAAKSGSISSHKYFSRLSKRFFKPSSPLSSSNAPPTPRPKLSPTKPQQRLCSLKRKSNNYFATQAWKSSPSPTAENSHDRHPDSDRDWQIKTMHQGDMGNQASTHTPLQDAPALMPRSPAPMFAHPSDKPARMKKETTNSDAVDFGSGQVIPDEPPMTRVMKRPLPPPKSRHTVQEEAKEAGDIIDLISDSKDAGPIVKKMKIRTEEKIAQPPTELTKAAVGSSETAMCLQEAWDQRVGQQQVQKPLAQVAGGGSNSTGNDVRKGGIGSKNESTTNEKRKRKLFSTLSANDVAARSQHAGAAPNGNKLFNEQPGLSSDSPGLLRPQTGNSVSESAKGAVQLVNGPTKTASLDQTNSMFIDEGYSSLPVPGINNDDLVPENEDELMRRINGSLGLSSPFVQNCRAKAAKTVTPEQAYAAKQQERDVERSRRMREANLAAKEQKSTQMANRGGGLSVGFLEDTEPRKEGIDPSSVRRKAVSDGGTRSEHQTERHRLPNGDRLSQSKAHAQCRPGDALTTNSANQRHGTIAEAALLDIAENHVKNHGSNGLVSDTQKRSSASAKPSEKLAADSEVAGPRNEDAAETGFIPLLEQRLNGGVPGVKRTAGVSDLESRKSIISRLAPHWRKKRLQMGKPSTASTSSPKESRDDRLAAESRLLELRNAPVSGNASFAAKKLPKVSQGASLLDQLIKEREGHATLSAESQISGQEGHSMEKPSFSKPKRKEGNKRAKATVENAEAGLLRMGLSASLFRDWKDTRKCFWASREQEFAGRKEELEEAIAKSVRKRNTPEVNLRTSAPTGRKRDKRSNSNVAAAEAVLRDSGLSASLIQGLSGYQKAKWAKEEALLAEKKQEWENFIAMQQAQDRTTSVPESSTEKQANNTPWQDTAPVEAEASESEESEEEEGWKYAIKWQGIEQPQNLADTLPLTHVIAKGDTPPEESASEDEEDPVKEPEIQIRSNPGILREQTRIDSPGRYDNRQKPDEDLLCQMQRKHFNDLNDEEELFHEYVVKVETWGMTDFPADHILILGRYLDKDKAEEMVRDFILSCKPDAVFRDLEIQSVWSDGNFSQKMIRDGEAGCRAFVEPVVVSARQYPSLKDKIARRKTYAVLFERTISRKSANGEAEEDVTATTVDNMQVFTTKSFANWQAKKEYQNWYKEHLDTPQDKCWLRMHDEDLCRHVEELNEEGVLFSRKEHIMKGGATDTMRVWVREIAPKGPRN